MTEVFLVERLLECGICFEMLNETCKMLPCQHTYCKACLEGTRQHEGCLRCPQCRTTIEVRIDDLPKNLVLLNLIEQVKKKPPPEPRSEDDDLAKAVTISMEEFEKESATNLLLKHNEQLQTQLALENSKRDALLKSEQQAFDEYNEFFHFQTILDQSEKEESFKRKNQNLLSEKEKLECQLVLLKSELEANAARSSNSSDMTSLFSWFAKNINKISDDQRKEAQKGLESLRKAIGTHISDDSTLTQLQLLIEKMKKDDKGNPNNVNQNFPSTSKDDGDEAINDVMKNLKELKTMLREEGFNKTTRSSNEQRNYFYPPNIPPLLNDQQMHFSKPRFHDPLFPTSAYRPGKEGPHHPRYFPPSMPPFFYRPPTFPSKFDSRNAEEVGNFSNRGRNVRGHRGGRGRGGPTRSVFEKLGFDRLQNAGKEVNDSSGSLILPDVRDYKRLDKNSGSTAGGKGESDDRKYDNRARRASLSSSAGIRGPLMLPDVRHYDEIYSKFCKSTETSGNTKCDNKPFGSDFKERRANFEGKSGQNLKAPYRGKKPYRGRGGKHFSNRSKSTEKNDGSESDSSVTSQASCSSHLSTASTPAGLATPRRNNYFRGNKYKQRNSDYYNVQKKFHENTGRNSGFYRRSDQADDMKRLTYPSKQDALNKNLDLNKKFDTPVICLGKEGNKPVSRTVECLADVYEFEGKYQDCKVIRI